MLDCFEESGEYERKKESREGRSYLYQRDGRHIHQGERCFRWVAFAFARQRTTGCRRSQHQAHGTGVRQYLRFEKDGLLWDTGLIIGTCHDWISSPTALGRVQACTLVSRQKATLSPQEWLPCSDCKKCTRQWMKVVSACSMYQDVSRTLPGRERH